MNIAEIFGSGTCRLRMTEWLPRIFDRRSVWFIIILFHCYGIAVVAATSKHCLHKNSCQNQSLHSIFSSICHGKWKICFSPARHKVTLNLSGFSSEWIPESAEQSTSYLEQSLHSKILRHLATSPSLLEGIIGTCSFMSFCHGWMANHKMSSRFLCIQIYFVIWNR